MFACAVTEGIATVTMNAPPVNAMSDAWVAGFVRLLDALEARMDWSVLHLRSALKIFAAGADLKEMRARFAVADGVAAQLAAVRGYQALFARIEALPRVTLAEIGGSALGGGLELALACDLRVAAWEAKLGLPELRLGLLPGAGGTQRLTRLCGRAASLRLILGAEMVDGAEAKRLGLVQWGAPSSELPAAATAIARRYAALPAHAVAAAKSCITSASDPARDGFREEIEQTGALLHDDRTRVLVRGFLDRSDRNGAERWK